MLPGDYTVSVELSGFTCHMRAVKLDENLRFANHWIGVFGERTNSAASEVIKQALGGLFFNSDAASYVRTTAMIYNVTPALRSELWQRRVAS